VWFVIVLGLALAACGQNDKLTVRDAWGRISPAAAENGAFYLTIENGTDEDDVLLIAATEACDTVELHEMYMREGDVMGMRPVPGGTIAVPAGETVRLEPGGLHVMCLGKRIPFGAGAEVPLTLTFDRAGTMNVVADIREMAP
jgi:copper(I)-binding protein